MFNHLKYNFEPNSNKVWLSSPTLHPVSRFFMLKALDWMSTVGADGFLGII